MSDIISAQQLRLAAEGKVNESNMNSVLVALNACGKKFDGCCNDCHADDKSSRLQASLTG